MNVCLNNLVHWGLTAVFGKGSFTLILTQNYSSLEVWAWAGIGRRNAIPCKRVKIKYIVKTHKTVLFEGGFNFTNINGILRT